jgi:hypothetical protein
LAKISGVGFGTLDWFEVRGVPMPPLFAEAAVTAVQLQGYAVGWGTLSLINAGLAQSKNRSGLAWWFVSLLLGPIATFIIVALLDRRPEI